MPVASDIMQELNWEVAELESEPKIEANTDQPQQYDWAELVTIAEEMRSAETLCKWTLGDVSLKAMDFAGSNKDARTEYLDRFARETKIEQSSLKQYAWVSNAYPPADRNISPLLSWSHYREAINAEDPIKWLKKAADNDWSVAQLNEQLAVAKENKDIELGKPCSREGCANSVSLDKNLRVSVQAYGQHFLFCSLACSNNVMGNDLAAMRASTLGEEWAGVKLTSMIKNPAPNSPLTPEEWFALRQDIEKDFMLTTYSKKPLKVISKEPRMPKPMVLAPIPIQMTIEDVS